MAMASAVVGCADEGDRGVSGLPMTARPSKARGAIKEIVGEYAGIRLGDSRQRVLSRFGKQPKNAPDSSEFDHPYFIPSGVGTIDYGDVSVLFGEADQQRARTVNPGRVSDLAIYGRGARTKRGVGIGDSLGRVKSAYPDVRCIPYTSLEHDSRGPSCSTRLAPRRYIYFGGDPITEIDLAVYPLED
jgi:hypothetical protein